jgi:hypothetical protein
VGRADLSLSISRRRRGGGARVGLLGLQCSAGALLRGSSFFFKAAKPRSAFDGVSPSNLEKFFFGPPEAKISEYLVYPLYLED